MILDVGRLVFRHLVPARAKALAYPFYPTDYTRYFAVSYGACARLVRRHGLTVVAGPFAGMRYVDTRAGGSPLGPKLLGTFELELHEVLARIVANGVTTVVNVGAAEGYYAIGLARAMPDAYVAAFEAQRGARRRLRALMAANGLAAARIDVDGWCGREELQAALAGSARAVVICDIEGYEGQLLDPLAVPVLRRCDVLVELHEFFAPGVTRALVERFAGTHELRRIAARPRTLADWPGLDGFGDEEKLALMDEFRHPEQQWLWMTARRA